MQLTLEMIKIEHTLFALPFAFLGAVLASNGLPSLRQCLWITVAMIGARSTAMAFNRIVDREYDALNPRTSSRALPAGLLSVGFVASFTLVSATLFFGQSNTAPAFTGGPVVDGRLRRVVCLPGL